MLLIAQRCLISQTCLYKHRGMQCLKAHKVKCVKQKGIPEFYAEPGLIT